MEESEPGTPFHPGAPASVISFVTVRPGTTSASLALPLSPLAMPWSVRGRPHTEPAEAALAARFDALVRSEYARLAEYAYVLVTDHADAEEIVQDVLFGVWRHRNHFDFERPVPYLVRAVRNRALSRRQLLARRTSRMLATVHDETVAASDDSLERDELLRDLDAAVASLPARSREIFLLHRVNGLSYAEIAETLGISRKTVENLMGARSSGYARLFAATSLLRS